MDRPARHVAPDLSPGLAVLVVCTGNTCRSPAAERLLVAGLGSDAGVRVSSAGTRAVVGHPVAAPMTPLLVAAGAGVEAFAARQLTPADIRAAGVVIAMTRAHRSAVVDLAPAAVRRTFTLRELARLVAAWDPAGAPDAPAERLATAAGWAARSRRPHPVDPDLDDVDDPWGGSDRLYERVFAEIHEAVDVLVTAARG